MKAFFATIKIPLLIALVTFCSYLIIRETCTSCFNKQSNLSDIKFMDVPTVKYLRTDSLHIDSTGYKQDYSTIIFHFDPACHNCKDETASIVSKLDSFNKTQIYFLSVDSIKHIRNFMNHYKLDDHPNIKFGKDIYYEVINLFQVKSIPTTFVYDNKGELVKVFEGGVNADSLLSVINKFKSFAAK